MDPDVFKDGPRADASTVQKLLHNQLEEIFGKNFKVNEFQLYLHNTDNELDFAYKKFSDDESGWYCTECEFLFNVIILINADRRQRTEL